MSRSSSVLLGALFACVVVSPAASAADDVQSLKAEIDALKADYAQRVAALEDRISQLEAASAAAASGPAASAPAAEAAPEYTPPAPAGGQSGATAFNPAMSVILSGNYTNLSQDPADYHIA